MNVSEKTMQALIDIIDEEIGPNFSIDDLIRVAEAARTRCEKEQIGEEDMPGVFAAELREFKQSNKIFGLGRFKYALLFQNPGAPVGAA